MTKRDLMAPDTEPTDEELALVMREARDVAIADRAKADAWIAAKLKEASEFARQNSAEELARQKRAAERSKVMVLHKTRLGEPEVDFAPVKGAAAISLATQLTVESFSLADLDGGQRAGDPASVRFVPRTQHDVKADDE